MVTGMDSTQLLLSIIGVLVTGMWWSVKTGLTRLMAKLDAMEARQNKVEKDCVTWADHENLKLTVNGVDRRVTVLETVCDQQHGGK
jgi:hypothetical protein